MRQTTFFFKYIFLIFGLIFSSEVNGQQNNNFTIYVEESGVIMNATFPGTKWCGPGDIARDYNDLGRFRKTDMCCRAHDHCEYILPKEKKHGLTNSSKFSRLTCNCDRNFFECLQEANSFASNIIGTLYFQSAQKCYTEDYPIIKCIKRERASSKRCVQYIFDESKTKLYQWFDIPHYSFGKYPDYHSETFE